MRGPDWDPGKRSFRQSGALLRVRHHMHTTNAERPRPSYLKVFCSARDELLSRLYEDWLPPDALAYAGNAETIRGLFRHRHELAIRAPQLPEELVRSNTLFGIPLLEDPSLPTGHLRCVVHPEWRDEMLC